MDWFYSVFFLIVLSLVLVSLIYFLKNPDKYIANLQFIRKVFYAIYFVGIGIGILIETIDMRDWHLLVGITILFIFIDLAVFQTPDITKIGNAEFQHTNYFQKVIRENDETIGYHFKKAQGFTSVIAKTELHFNSKDIPTDWSGYKDELSTYLNLYADTFRFHVSIFEFDTISDALLLKESLTNAFNDIEQCYNKTIEDADWKEALIQQLLDGKSVECKDKKEEKSTKIPGELKNEVYIVAFYGDSYNMLITLSSRFVEVDGIDASNTLNLAQIFDWYMT